MSRLWGSPTPQEWAIAESVSLYDSFENDSVRCYDRLVEKYGVDGAGRIWGAACQIADKRSEND